MRAVGLGNFAGGLLVLGSLPDSRLGDWRIFLDVGSNDRALLFAFSS